VRTVSSTAHRRLTDPDASAAGSPAPVKKKKKPPVADLADSPASVKKKSWSNDSGGSGGSADSP
jgi:hypothetical protein